MSAPSLRIGVDLDGVCYSFDGAHRTFLQRAYGMDPMALPIPTKWETWECWGMTKTEWFRTAVEGVDEGIIFREGAPLPGTLAALRQLKDWGHSLHIVTNRDIGSRSIENTAGWLAEYEVPFDTLTFSADKTVVDVDLFIDDRVDNVLDLVRANIPAVLRDQPWNRTEAASGLPRVYGWGSFLDVVKEITDLATAMGIGQ